MEFKGVGNQMAELYIVDSGYHAEDRQFPMSGPRGAVLVSLLGSMAILDKTRIGNLFSQDVIADMSLCPNLKVIVGVGSEIINKFIVTSKSIENVSGTVFKIKFNGKECYFIPLTDPSNLIINISDQKAALKFSQDLYKAAQILNGEYRDILAEKNVMSAHSFDEFLNIYNTYFTNDTIVAYDIETTARPIFMEGSEIIGFSIGNKKNGVYACLKSLDFEMPKEDIDKIWEFTKSNIFDKKRLIIHNTMYERPYTLYCLNYEIKFEQADDTLVMTRMLKNPKESAGLKYQAQTYLGYPDWETDLTRYIENFIAFYNRVAIGPKKFEKLWNDIYHNETSIFKLKELGTFADLKYADQLEIDSIVDNLKSVLVDLYNEEEIIHIGKLITNKIIEVYDQGGIKDSTIPYNWIPDRVLSKYGAIDSISTFDLRDYCMDIMDKESTDKVDLHKGYENWLEHMYVAYIMERNGMYWNEELVKKDEKFLNDQALKSLKVMLKSPLFQPYIRRVCEDKYKPILLSDYFPEIAESQGYRVDYDRTTGKYTIFYNGKRVAKAYLDSIDVNANAAYRKPYEDTLYDLFNEDVEKATHWEDLKDLYNPSSSNYNWVPRAILMTPRVQIGAKINKLDVLGTGELESKKDSFPAIDKKFLDIAELLCNHELEEGGKFTLPEKYGDNWAEKRKELYDGFCLLYQNYKNQVTVPEIKAVLKEKESLEIESFDDNGMIAIYNAQVVDGIDPDNPDTYDEEFKWMINFRLFKKTQKLITSYINGSVGRESVTIVDKNELSSGNTRLTRKRKYFDTEGKISEGETYLLASKWMPNTAETGRWRSAIHTLPWSSPIKRYYSSRFNGGTIICPDYSQMEVRSLAAISKDKNMLELFSSGKDFHKETAKSIYQKEEVTDAERRFSKAATFSLLYGSTVSSFANKYCKGDMTLANKIYGGFFKAYPEVEDWVEKRHEEVKKDHRVSLELSGRFIRIEPEGNDNGAIAAMLRKAQNYPIQATSADLTGCVVYDLQKFIEDRHMKSLIFMYVHDSIEADIYPYEMIEFIDYLKVLLNEAPKRRMGLISKADVALGKSLGHEIDLKELEHNEDYTDCVMTLKGFQDEIYETVENWKLAYKTVEIYDEEWEEYFVSVRELFIAKKAYTPTIGTMRYKGTCKVHINYYK